MILERRRLCTSTQRFLVTVTQSRKPFPSARLKSHVRSLGMHHRTLVLLAQASNGCPKKSNATKRLLRDSLPTSPRNVVLPCFTYRNLHKMTRQFRLMKSSRFDTYHEIQWIASFLLMGMLATCNLQGLELHQCKYHPDQPVSRLLLGFAGCSWYIYI